MTDDTDSTPVSSETPEAKATALQWSYDNEKRTLSVLLSDAAQQQDYDLERLRGQIAELSVEGLEVPASALDEVLQRIRRSERGAFVVMVKPEYTVVDLLYDEESRELRAELTASDIDPQLNLYALQQMVELQGYKRYLSSPAILQQLLKRIAGNERGVFTLGRKPEYTALSLQVDQEEGVLSAVLSLSETDLGIDIAYIQRLIEEGGFSQWAFEPEAVAQLYARILKAERGSFPLARRLNAQVHIRVSRDDMQAYIRTTAAQGGLVLSQAQLEAAIAAQNIDIKYCNQDVLARALAAPALDEQLLNQGREPVNGVDAVYEALVSEVSTHGPVVGENDIVDFRDIQDFTVVEAGAALMRRTPATPGVNGYNVFGQMLPAKPGLDPGFMANLPGAMIDPNDPDLLIAENPGHPVVMANGVRVDKLLKVNNVDIRSGNIRFDGSLLVTGEVKPDMKIDVTGDVTIQGIVDGARIRAGNDIVVVGGVMGRELKQEGDQPPRLSARLTAGGAISAKFASFAELKAGTSIEVNEYLAHCDVEAAVAIKAGQGRGKGRVFGGICHAEGGVIANEYGSDASVRTRVTAGYSIAKKKEYEGLKSSKERLLEMAAELEQQFKDLVVGKNKADMKPEDIAKAKEIKKNFDQMKKDVASINSRLQTLRSELNGFKDARITVVKKAYPNVSINVNGVEYTVRSEVKAGSFSRQGDEIVWEAGA